MLILVFVMKYCFPVYFLVSVCRPRSFGVYYGGKYLVRVLSRVVVAWFLWVRVCMFGFCIICYFV